MRSEPDIAFRIVEDLGTRVALDTEYHFARICLSTGEIVTASFDQRNFAGLSVGSRAIRASVAGRIFSHGPTTYNTADAIDARVREDSEAVGQALDAYGREAIAYREGRRTTKPSFPNWDEIPHWVDDYKLAEFGATPRGVGVLHLHIHTDDLRIKARPAKLGYAANLRHATRHFASGLARILIHEFEQARQRYERHSRESSPGLIDPLIFLFDVAADLVVAKMRSQKAPQRRLSVACAVAPRRAPG